MEPHELLALAARRATAYVDGVASRPVGVTVPIDELRQGLARPLDDDPVDPGRVVDDPVDPGRVIDELVMNAEPGVVATGSPRFFGFVIGGALPVALAADWLTSAWDQNAGLYVGGPSAAIVEEVAGGWLLDILGLPSTSSFAFVTGCQMAHFTALAAARHHVLGARGWDVGRQGLFGAPPIRIVAGGQRHVTLDRALGFLGIGSKSIVALDADGGGKLTGAAVADALGDDRSPTIVCAQVGEVNTGAIDEVGAICEAAHRHGAWVHVDGAFGLWAAASPRLRPLLDGVELADSWATDCHKWLNVPYDCGLAVCAHPRSHNAAMGTHADYLVHAGDGGPRDELDWTPEFSRRARGFPVYAALRGLGRRGVARLVDGSCDAARRFAELLGRDSRVEVLNDVVLNQVLVRYRDKGGDHDALTRRVIAAVQQEGTCWMSGTTWHSMAAMRISVVNWQTTHADVELSVQAILAVLDRLSVTPRNP